MIDDEEMNQEFVKCAVEDHLGWTCWTAGTSDQALEVVAHLTLRFPLIHP